jgi:5,10-methylenetetrahydrofolate reductase
VGLTLSAHARVRVLTGGARPLQLTLEICCNASRNGGLETCMHLTCTNMPKAQIDEALRVRGDCALTRVHGRALRRLMHPQQTCREAGIQNILALRGGP